MRKALCLVLACILALVFVSASNVSALGIGKILYAEYLISAKIKFFDDTGAYDGGAGGGDGIVYIGDSDVDIAYAFLVDSFDMAVPGSTAWFTLYDYTWNSTKSLLKSFAIDMDVYDPDGLLIDSYSGPCVAKITFSSAKAFTGTITITIDGSKMVITIKGKKFDQWPGPKPAP